jgi:hypothetical protein
MFFWLSALAKSSAKTNATMTDVAATSRSSDMRKLQFLKAILAKVDDLGNKLICILIAQK